MASNPCLGLEQFKRERELGTARYETVHRLPLVCGVNGGPDDHDQGTNKVTLKPDYMAVCRFCRGIVVLRRCVRLVGRDAHR